MIVLRSFWRGWVRATALWPVVLLLYLVDAAFALILTLPPATRLSQLFGHSAMAPMLLGPVSLDWLVETPGSWDVTFFPWPLYLLVPLLFLLVETFLRGGVVGVLVWGAPPFRWTNFFSDCARFFLRFVLLPLLFFPGLILAVLLFLLLNLLLGAVPAGDVTTAVRLAAVPFLLFLLLLAMDYARISLAQEAERALWRHAWRGFRFLVLRFPRALSLGVAFLLVAVLLGALYPALTGVTDIANTHLAGLLVQQLSILLLCWQRVASLAGEVVLYREG